MTETAASESVSTTNIIHAKGDVTGTQQRATLKRKPESMSLNESAEERIKLETTIAAMQADITSLKGQIGKLEDDRICTNRQIAEMHEQIAQLLVKVMAAQSDTSTQQPTGSIMPWWKVPPHSNVVQPPAFGTQTAGFSAPAQSDGLRCTNCQRPMSRLTTITEWDCRTGTDKTKKVTWCETCERGSLKLF